MTGYNLPPGCNTSDIPGNRPEDAAEEAFWDAFTARCEEEGIDMAPIDPDSSTAKLITIARDLGLNEGFGQGRDDARAEFGALQMERDERRFNYEGERLDVQRLVRGDKVQAVRTGPIGTVVDADRSGWTIVRYSGNGRDVPYKHGAEKLTLVAVA
jgi:hypothetical protein